MSARTDTEASSNQASSGITPDTLGATLREKLEASHVDVQDLSGKDMPFAPLGLRVLTVLFRWLRPDVRSDHSITAIYQEDNAG